MKNKIDIYGTKDSKRKTDAIYFSVIKILVALLLIGYFFILTKIFVEGSEVINYDFLTSAPKGNFTEGGIGPAILGTFFVTLLMIIFAVPIGVCAALYMNEYTQESKLTKLLRVSVNSLSGVPSIVFGLFGMGFFVLLVGKNIDELLKSGTIFGQPSMLWASVTLALMVLPIIIIPTIEALEAVPKAQREAAYGLGTTKWEMIKKILLPEANSGILTGIILSVARGAGETAPILFLGCAFFLPNIPVAYLNLYFFEIPMINPMEHFMHLGYHLFILTTQSANPIETMPYKFGTTLVLLSIIILLNTSAIYFRYRFRRVLERMQVERSINR